MSLYLKYRPQSFSEVIGNAGLCRSLEGMVKDKTICPHAFLLHGPTGCGKTTIGRIIAKELNCAGNDFNEIDSADFRGIDTVRDIRSRAFLKPIESSCRVYLIDECHKMTNDAQNALLKILEDTPRHVYFILATTEPEKLLKTIKGRCSTFAVNLLRDGEMMTLLRKIVKAEGENLAKLVYETIIESAQGHPRNALQILEQVLRVEGDERVEMAKRTAEVNTESIELCRLLIKKSNWSQIAEILKNLKSEDPESIRRVVLGYCQSVLLNGVNNQAAHVMEEFIEPFYNTGFPGLTFACYSSINS